MLHLLDKQRTHRSRVNAGTDTTGVTYPDVTTTIDGGILDLTYGPFVVQLSIDTGIKELAILSDGSSYENIRSLNTKLKKLSFGQVSFRRKHITTIVLLLVFT